MCATQLKNKQDYARLHSYEVHLMAETVDHTVRPGAWQKVAFLLQVPHLRWMAGLAPVLH